MRYNNSFILSICGEAKMKVQFCEKCNEVKTGKFCSDCGGQLTDKMIDVKEEQIFSELRQESEDCGYLLDEVGSSYENGSGGNVIDDIKKFSKKYPDLIFELNTTWDKGFDDPPSRDFFKNGKRQKTRTKVVFEDYDESKLK